MESHIQLLEKLISNAAVSSQPENVNRSMDTVAEYLAAAGIPQLTFETFGDRKVLFAANRPGKVQDVILNMW